MFINVASILLASLSKKDLVSKSFVSRLIPVFWDTNKKPFRSVTLKWWFTLTYPNDVVRILDTTSSGIFFPLEIIKTCSGD